MTTTLQMATPVDLVAFLRTWSSIESPTILRTRFLATNPRAIIIATFMACQHRVWLLYAQNLRQLDLNTRLLPWQLLKHDRSWQCQIPRLISSSFTKTVTRSTTVNLILCFGKVSRAPATKFTSIISQGEPMSNSKLSRLGYAQGYHHLTANL